MVATSNPTDASKPHVPAWRRLGLKLKSEPDTLEQSLPTLPATATANDSQSKKRSAAKSDGDSQPAKKSKFIAADPEPVAAVPSTPINRLKRSKSVTFTPETKVEDGDSIKQLFNTWVAQQNSDDQAFEDFCRGDVFSTPEPPKVEETVDPTITDEKEKRIKRVKKPKEEKTNKVTKVSKVVKPAAPPQRLSPALDYLRQYRESRDTWKFNKNHQTYLLKHAFNTETIPVDYNELLYLYVAGLQGGVRKRLRDEALAEKVKDIDAGAKGFPKKMDDTERKQQEYDAAVAEYVAECTSRNAPKSMTYEEGVRLGLSDAAMQPRIAKRLRAERVLAELAAEDVSSGTSGSSTVTEDEKRLKMNDGSAQKVGRKRKQRTVVEDDTSSSEDSSSDSETSSSGSSDDDSDDEEKEEESTSSSSSSSSSSDEESDSDDSEESE